MTRYGNRPDRATFLAVQAKGYIDRVIAEHPGWIRELPQKAVFGRYPLNFADARHPGRFIEFERSGAIFGLQ